MPYKANYIKLHPNGQIIDYGFFKIDFKNHEIFHDTIRNNIVFYDSKSSQWVLTTSNTITVSFKNRSSTTTLTCSIIPTVNSNTYTSLVVNDAAVYGGSLYSTGNYYFKPLPSGSVPSGVGYFSQAAKEDCDRANWYYLNSTGGDNYSTIGFQPWETIYYAYSDIAQKTICQGYGVNYFVGKFTDKFSLSSVINHYNFWNRGAVSGISNYSAASITAASGSVYLTQPQNFYFKSQSKTNVLGLYTNISGVVKLVGNSIMKDQYNNTYTRILSTYNSKTYYYQQATCSDTTKNMHSAGQIIWAGTRNSPSGWWQNYLNNFSWISGGVLSATYKDGTAPEQPLEDLTFTRYNIVEGSQKKDMYFGEVGTWI